MPSRCAICRRIAHWLATVIDGHPAAPARLGGVRGHQTISMGGEHFGQTGTIGDLYREHGIKADAIAMSVSRLTPGRPQR